MYYIVFGFLYLISLLPFFILYRLSDLAYIILYYVIDYRKKIIMQNLQNAFPEKSEDELKRIARIFIRNFTDNWIETIKLLSISKKSLNKRISTNIDVFTKLYNEGKSVQLNLGHFFNWEIMTLFTGINQPFTFLTVYLPQTSEVTNKLFLNLRSRWGNPQLSVKNMAKAIIPWRKKKFLLALGADQNPPDPQNAYWLNFMHQPTPFLKGTEKLSRIQQTAVVMLTTTRPKRGHYHFDYFLLTDDPDSLPEGELIRRYVKHLEDNIRLQPEIYLWSHRRWKHKWKAEYKNQWVDHLPVPDEKANFYFIK